MVKNLNIRKSVVTFGLVLSTSIPILSGCNQKETEDYKEGILIVGDQEYIIKYKKYDYGTTGNVMITLVDGKEIKTSFSNFIAACNEKDEDSEEFEKIKQKVKENGNVIE